MGGVMATACLWLFWLTNPALATVGGTLIIAQTVTFAAIGVFQLVNTFTVRGDRAFELPSHNFRWPLISSILIGGAVLAFAITGGGTTLLGTTPLSEVSWRLIFLTLIIVVFVIEAHKFIEQQFTRAKS